MLSKYDIMSRNMEKFSSIVTSFIGAYALAFSKKKKYEVLKKYYEIKSCLHFVSNFLT
jgi:hypothetical protein